jgi:hypothetical protein
MASAASCSTQTALRRVVYAQRVPEELGRDERERIGRALAELAKDEVASTARISACEVLSDALARAGLVLWVGGVIVGPDRVSRVSPFGFGDDRTVGIATVAQIAGELGRGAVELLQGKNRYAASALLRQLIEVEYLAHAFDAGNDTAAEWLRADAAERRRFWSPQRLRNRADGRFIDEHYWRHCELGGHPTTEGMALLPEHAREVGANYLWVDLVGHLSSVWTYVVRATERVIDSPISTAEWHLPDVGAAVDEWRSKDRLYAALQSLGEVLGEERQAPM